MSIQELLAPLAGRRCCVAYRLVPTYDERGNRLPKDDKIPLSPITGRGIRWMDASQWVTPEQAMGSGMPVAIVLHEGLNVFCVDIDQQIAVTADGQWSPFAQQMYSMFPGAALEVSASGRALHIFGWYDTPQIPAHRVSRRDMHGLEIYTRNRFIALTGNVLTGCLWTDHTRTLAAAIAHYFPGPIATDAEWTTGPYEGWRGGGSDEQLLNKMINGQGGSSAVFGSGVHFRDLWGANAEVMARAYPTDQPGKAWNYNGADQALANHLVWHTGCDCERALRLMWGSALRRDKWQRDDYLKRTILRAVAGKIPEGAQTQGVSSAPAVAPVEPANLTTQSASVPPPPEPSPAPPKPPRAIGTYMHEQDQVELFDGCTYVRDIQRILDKDGALHNKSQFDATRGGYEYAMSVDGSGAVKSAWDAFTMSRIHKFPQVEGLFFAPRVAPGQMIYRDGLVYVNSWRDIQIERRKGDPTLFLAHLAKVLPAQRDQEIFLAYLAFIAQYRGTKSDWCPLLQGVEGNGKSTLSYIAQYCVGERYTHWPLARNLGEKFNAAFYGKLFIAVEDLKISESKQELWEAIKPMITGKKLEITPKGVDSVSREICFNFILNSNHKDALRKTRNDRRIAPFFCPQQHEADLNRCGLNEAYFEHLIGWLEDAGGYAICYDYLMSYQIPEKLNPAVGAHRAPLTSSTEQAIRAGRGAAEQEIVEAIEEGRAGFRHGWISSTAVDKLFMDIGKSRAVPREKRRELIESLGFVLHPGLPEGRVVNPLPDGVRPKLYIARGGHPSEDPGLQPTDVATMYYNSQKIA